MITTRMQTVSPAKAKEWLATQKTNRPISKRDVRNLQSEIELGRWNPDVSSIKLNGDGRLIDGQHRLHAIVQADTPVECRVEHGVSSDVALLIDTGRPRTLRDFLVMQGEKNANNLATVVKAAHSYIHSEGETLSLHSDIRPKAMDYLQFLRDHPGLRLSVGMAARVFARRTVRISPRFLGAVHFILSFTDEGMAEEFISGLASGAGVSDSDPRHTFRRLLFRAAREDRFRIPEKAMLVYYVKTWNAWTAGEPLSRLYWRADAGVPLFRRVDGGPLILWDES